LKPHDVHHGLDGISFVLPTSGGPLAFSSTLVGRHNIYNLLAGIGIAQALGIDAEAIRQGVARLRQVPGRLERVDCGQGVTVFVDYAHTPAALEQVLRLVRTEAAGRLITVFGCGGDRDPGKRPLMGQAATLISDYTIITSDNPRTEDPQRIIDDIVDGLPTPSPSYAAVLDRRQAIEQAIAMAEPQDTVLIAGKGHEDYQIIGQQRYPFDDREIARAACHSEKR
ncbi:MAG: UDP-N-acetylmuramyl-tripeptide synthetase, partial [Candidatus Tectomicrobia bacterium]|nr:UDP-N-acetylmuramyl-tripeptide synthetase [Candidatus Tectomicrobia bacterium]